MKFIILTLVFAGIAVTHCNAKCMHAIGTSSEGTLEPAAAGDRTSIDCHVVLAVDSAPRLRITLTNIDMPYTREFDDMKCLEWLEVRDGPSQDSKLLGEYCGDKELLSLPITIESSGKFMFVR